MALTKEQIFTAADALLGDGVAPTLESIRARLGVTTPPLSDVISETDAMNAWRARSAAKTQRPTESAPPAISARVTQFSNELWTVALEHSNRRLAPERQALEATRAELETKQRQAQSDTQALHADLISANGRAAAALARVDELEKRAVDLNTKLVQISGQNHELVAAIKTTVGIVKEA